MERSGRLILINDQNEYNQYTGWSGSWNIGNVLSNSYYAAYKTLTGGGDTITLPTSSDISKTGYTFSGV